MIETLYFFTSLLVFLWIFRNTLFWVALWQTKEYRVDRLLTHIRETTQGRSLLFSSINLAKLVFIGSYVYIVLHEAFLPLYAIGVALIYFCEFIVIAKSLILRRFKRPVLTMKALILVVCTLVILWGLYSLKLIQQEFLWLLILDKVTPFLIAFFVFFLSVPTILFQDYKIDKAIKRMQKLSHIMVIGVTGSYGKSSTKEYIAQILSKKFLVAKTHGTNNTPIGIANAVLRNVTAETQILVAEMGAYKRGEIAELCQIVRPQIGIITAVAKQHLSLFGSVENLARTKFELIESLPSSGIGIFNGNNDGSTELYKKTKHKKILYRVQSSHTEKVQKDTFIATNVRVEKKSVHFSVLLDDKIVQFSTPLIGGHTIENILPGIYVAKHLGMTTKEIQDAVASLTQLPKTMGIYSSISGTTLVDDTFNVNPDGIIAALKYASIYTGKKMLVLEPMIELGSSAESEHIRVGEAIAQSCDIIFLTKKNFVKQIEQGIANKKGTCIVKIAKPQEIAAYIQEHTNKSDIVIFEGKEAAVSMNKIV